MNYKTHLFFRKPEAGFNSIENVFGALGEALATYGDVKKMELPETGLSLKSIRKNLKYVKNNRADINHITGHVNYIALCTGRKSILTIHDMISAIQGNVFKNLFILMFWFWIPALMVKKITVISNYTYDEVKRWIPFAKHKVSIIQNPLSSKFTYQPKQFDVQKPKILCVGTKANKNLNRIFEALQHMECEVLILGKLNNDQLELLQEFSLNYTSFENISYDEVVNLYIKCDILCFASLFEGFGMPIIEAQAIGRPVITSNLGAMKETARASARLVDPFDSASIKNGIIEICNNELYRTELIQKGLENVKRFKVDKIAQEYIKVYNEVWQA